MDVFIHPRSEAMNHNETIKALLKNRGVFNDLLGGIPEEQYLWRSDPEAWNLLEVICHLHDEEREDFRSRMQFIMSGASGWRLAAAGSREVFAASISARS